MGLQEEAKQGGAGGAGVQSVPAWVWSHGSNGVPFKARNMMSMEAVDECALWLAQARGSREGCSDEGEDGQDWMVHQRACMHTCLQRVCRIMPCSGLAVGWVRAWGECPLPTGREGGRGVRAGVLLQVLGYPLPSRLGVCLGTCVTAV